MGSTSTSRATEQAAHTALPQLQRPLRCLLISHIHAIDDALAQIGAYGEIRLIKNGGKLRFIQTVKSEVLKGEE